MRSTNRGDPEAGLIGNVSAMAPKGAVISAQSVLTVGRSIVWRTPPGEVANGGKPRVEHPEAPSSTVANAQALADARMALLLNSSRLASLATRLAVNELLMVTEAITTMVICTNEMALAAVRAEFAYAKLTLAYSRSLNLFDSTTERRNELGTLDVSARAGS